MADYISKIKLPGDEKTYTLKDEEARSLISSLGSPMHFVGVATAKITDGGTEDPTIKGYEFNEGEGAKDGDVVVYNNAEFVWTGEAWGEFGDLGSLGRLAYADTASVSYTPAGTVSVDVTATGTISEVSIVPTGTVTSTFTGTNSTFTGKGTVSGEVTSTFSGNAGTVNVTGTPAGTIKSTAAESTGNYTPTGTVAVTAGTTNYVQTVAAPTAESTFIGSSTTTTATTTANVFGASVAEETLTLTSSNGAVTVNAFTPMGTVETTVAAPSVTTGKPTVTAAFTGKAVNLTFTGSSLQSTGSFTPQGTVSSALGEETEVEISVTGKPTGTVASTFKGTAGTATPTFTGTKVTATGTFKGTPTTIKVSPNNQ